MPAINGERLVTFEEGEEESEYGYVCKIPQTMGSPPDLEGCAEACSRSEAQGPRLRKLKTSKSVKRPAATEVDGEPVTPAGRVFMQPDLNCYIICTLGFQKPINVAEFKKTLSETLVKHKRFHSVLTKSETGRDIWVPVEVNIDAHVSESIEFNDTEKAAPHFIQSYVSHLQNSPPMDQSRPLWHCHILNGTSGTAASHMVIRVHHAFGDGTSLMSLLLACTRRLDSPDQLPSVPVASKKRKTYVARWYCEWFWYPVLLFWNTILGVLQFLLTVLWFRDSDSIIKGNSGVENAKKKIVCSVINISDMIAVKNAVEGTVNDVLMGMVAAGLHKYLESRYGGLLDGKILNRMRFTRNLKDLKGKNLPNVSALRLRAAAIVNTRGSPGLQELASMLKGGSQNRWGNNVGYVLFPIPLNHHSDALDHVRAAKKISDKKKNSLEAIFTYWAASLLMYISGPKLPAKLTRRVVLQTTLTISNMPGPTESVTFGGNPIVQMFPIVTGIPQAVSIFLQSYMGKATLVVMAAEDIVPDPELLCQYCVASLQDMLKSAWVLARAKPGHGHPKDS